MSSTSSLIDSVADVEDVSPVVAEFRNARDPLLTGVCGDGDTLGERGNTLGERRNASLSTVELRSPKEGESELVSACGDGETVVCGE